MENKYIACMLLHALGDTIGFKNTEWEFSEGGYERTLKKVYEFISLGGITGINLKGWLVSDDTIMHMQTARAMIKYSDNSSVDTMGKLLVDYFLEALGQFEIEGKKRAPGIATMKSLIRLKDGGKWDNNPYNIYSGGSGASMRSLCIGMRFPKSEDRHKLIQFAIESGRITNNSAVGYLGGVASALFASLAIEGIDIKKWPFVLLELFDNGTIQKYIKLSERGYDSYIKDSPIFIEKWHRYVDDKFDDKRNVIVRQSNINLVYRCKYYNETFGFRQKFVNKNNGNGSTRDITNVDGGKGVVRAFGSRENIIKNNNIVDIKGDEIDNRNDAGFIGSGGDDSVIIAYDALIDCNGNWEKLVYYSMLHMGDSDTTGAIAGGLYGLLYGIDNVGDHLLKHLEYKDELVKLGNDLYKKTL